MIVGAGPVGLFAAIQICLRRPSTKVVIFEKYPAYQRNHTLFVRRSAFLNAHAADASFRALLHQCVGKVKIAQLEQKLLDFVHSHAILKEQISIVYCRISADSVGALFEAYSHIKFVIGADGSHSTVRKLFFEDDLGIDEVCQHTALVKYDSKCATGSGKLRLRDRSNACGEIGMFVAESRNGDAQTLQFFIGKEEAAAIAGANFKNPIDATKTPRNAAQATLLHAVQTYMDARRKKLGESVTSQQVSVAYVPLKVYAAKFCARINKASHRSYFLAGDAFGGVPFFRAIHAGFLCASELARNVAEGLDVTNEAGEKSPEYLFQNLKGIGRKYSSYANLLMGKERQLAHGKNAFLSALDAFSKRRTKGC